MTKSVQRGLIFVIFALCVALAFEASKGETTEAQTRHIAQMERELATVSPGDYLKTDDGRYCRIIERSHDYISFQKAVDLSSIDRLTIREIAPWTAMVITADHPVEMKDAILTFNKVPRVL